jgi:hypothetical protein
MISLLFRIWQSLMNLRFQVESRLAGIEKALRSLEDGQRAIHRQLVQVLDTLIPGPAVKLVFTAHLDDGTTTEGVVMQTLRDDQKVLLTIQPLDAKGKPAAVDGAPVWSSSDETQIVVVAASDGLSAVASGVAPPADSTAPLPRIVVTADADLGSGVTPITGSLDFTITGGSAATIAITAGTPANQ